MNHLYFENLRATAANPREANLELQEIAADYCDQMGFPDPIPTPYAKVDETVAKQIAKWYEETSDQSNNPEVRKCYGAFVKEAGLQWKILIKDYGLHVEPFLDDFVPYKDSQEMMEDVRGNHHMWVYDGGEDHALMTRRETFIFRAAHDAFGHSALGMEFGPRGENGAWIEHCKMFSPSARRAMSSESRGQSSYVNAGPYSHLPARERPFAEQKAILMPLKWCTTPELQKAYREYPEFFPPVSESNPRRRR